MPLTGRILFFTTTTPCTMKKRYLIPAGLFAAFTGIAVVANVSVNNTVADCNAGQKTACETVVEHYDSAWDEITNKEYLPIIAAKVVAQEKEAEAKEAQAKADAKAESEAKAKAQKARAIAEAKITRIDAIDYLVDCDLRQIKPFLKDPDSYKQYSWDFKETNEELYISVDYSATNSFGGRVRSTKVCTYALNKETA